MSERHWPRPGLATTALALLGAGDYGASPDVQTRKQTMTGVKVTR